MWLGSLVIETGEPVELVDPSPELAPRSLGGVASEADQLVPKRPLGLAPVGPAGRGFDGQPH
jgi:hypothetical protein